MFDVREDDLSSEASRALVGLHLSGMHANSPAGGVFALDLSALKASDVTVWTVWSGEEVVGVAALKRLGDAAAEIKSMRTHPRHLRKGVAATLLQHIIREAGARGVSRLSLETGSGPAFEPAVTLYRSYGFNEGEAFSDYVRSDFNRFFHLAL